MSKKIIIASVMASFAAAPAMAESAAAYGLKVTLGGKLNTQVVSTGDKGIYRYDGLDTSGAKRSNFNIVNDTRVNVAVDGEKHGLKYGGKVELDADTSKNKYAVFSSYFSSYDASSNAFSTMVYVSNRFGRIEGGSMTGSSDKMSVRGASLARATGGTDGDYLYAINNRFMRGNQDGFIISNRFYTSATLPSNYVAEGQDKANKVSYFTPSYMGFKAGVSYIPDMEVKGTITQANGIHKKSATIEYGDFNNTFNYGLYRNVVTGGIHYKGAINGAKIKASMLGETGVAKNSGGTGFFHNLRAMQVGLSLGYKGFKIAGSYADLGRSGLLKTLTSGNRKTKFWDAAVSYKYNALGMSISYFESKRGGFANAPSITAANAKANKYTAWSFGVDYKLAPGFMPYAEYTAFKTNDANKSNANPLDNSFDAKGHVFLAGTKLEF